MRVRAAIDRGATVLVALALAVTAGLGAALHAARPAGAVDDGVEWAFVDAVNRARADAGLAPLVPLAGLRDVARAQTARLIQRGSLYHNPDLARDVTTVLPDWTRAGENVGYGGDVQSLDAAFLASPGHRANILGDYRYVGIGGDRGPDGRIWVTEVFAMAPAGRPALARSTPQAVTPAPAPAPQPVVPVTRLAGGDPTATSLAVSGRFPAGGSDVVVVARRDDFADALAGGPLAARGRGPVLLVDRSSVPASVALEARRVLAPGGKVVLLGGTAALPRSVADVFGALGLPVERVAGADRYATAADVARRVSTQPAEVLIASGTRFPDAIVAGAAGGSRGAPVLLVAPDGVPAATASYLASVPGAHRVVVGGDVAVAPHVADAVGAGERLAGADREATAVEVAARYFPGADRVSLATGGGFADALAGAPLAAMHRAPLLLVGGAPSPALQSYVDGVLGQLDGSYVFGAAVTDDLVGRLLS